MSKAALVTGGFGFLGRAVARRLQQEGYTVFGVGHGQWNRSEYQQHGFTSWVNAPVTSEVLEKLGRRFDVVVHCAGNGSVGYAQSHPHRDFVRTVCSAAELLEYMRLHNAGARLIYPSSAGVYGAKPDAPISEDDALNPISTYGYHKRIVEEMCENHVRQYGVRIAVIRFFSIYGRGLTKQLLWDASVRLSMAKDEATFYGSGDETRDWIHVDDAASLVSMFAVADTHGLEIVNGASGQRVTVREVLQRLRVALDVEVDIRFSGEARPGDPLHYQADVQRLRAFGVAPGRSLDAGLADYVDWFRGAWSP